MVHASKFKTNGDEYLIKVENISDRASFHHYIGYAIPADSSTLQPGGSLSNAVDGEVIDDCIDIGVASMLFSGDLGSAPVDLLESFGDDGSTANGYPYGIPIGAQTNFEWVSI